MNYQDALRWLCPQRKVFNREGAKVAKLREAERSHGMKAGGVERQFACDRLSVAVDDLPEAIG